MTGRAVPTDEQVKQTGGVAIDPELYFELSTDELREVTRFALAPVEQALGLLGQPLDPRVTAAVRAARRFADGESRSRLQRTAALDAHRAAKEAADLVSQHVAAAAGDASASAYLHPFAKGDQVGHILRSTAHVALAAEETGASDGELTAVLEDAVHRASPVLLEVLRRYPPFPAGRTRVAQVVCDLDLALRQV